MNIFNNAKSTIQHSAKATGRAAAKAGKAARAAGNSPAAHNARATGSHWVSDLRYGRSISLSFFRNNAWLMLVILITVIALIGLRYETKTKMVDIKKLEIELTRSRSSKLQEKAAYMTLIRESEMRRLVTSKGLGLEFKEQPPYELEVP